MITQLWRTAKLIEGDDRLQKTEEAFGGWQKQLLIPAFICALFTIGAVLAFPEMDDTYLLLLLKEHGPGVIAAAHRDRPLIGFIWQTASQLLGSHFWQVSFVIHFLLWLLFVVETMVLWRFIFPEWRTHSWLVGILTAAPLVVQTQLSVVTISMLGLLSAVLAYGALCLFLRNDTLPYLAGLVLVLVAGLISEYAVPACAIAALIVWSARRRLLQPSLIGVAALLSYVAFRMVAAANSRANTDPNVALESSIPLAVTALLSRLWTVLAGSYGQAIADIQLDWQTKSTLAAAALGLLVACLATLLFPQNKSEIAFSKPRTMLLLTAVVIGLAPVALMRGSSAAHAFGSRFYLPVLPVAACLTLSVCLRITRARYRTAFIAGLVFLAVTVTVLHCIKDYRHQRTMAHLGDQLKPLVSAQKGNTILVAEGHHYEILAKLAVSWPGDLTRRVWLYREEEIDIQHACVPKPLDVRVYGYITRNGPIDNLIWVDLEKGEILPPHCVRSTSLAYNMLH